METEPSTSATGVDASDPSTAGAGAATGADSDALAEALGVAGLAGLAAEAAGAAAEAATGAAEEGADLTIGFDCYTHMSNVFLSCFRDIFSYHDQVRIFINVIAILHNCLI